MTDDDRGPAGADPGRRGRERAILAFATAGFFALLVFALGMVSLLTGEAVIAEPGLGQAPGILGTILAVAGFAAVTAWALPRGRAGAGSAVLTGLVAAASYCVGVAVGATVTGTDPLRALGIGASLAVSWVAAVIVIAGALAGAGAAVAARSGPGVPRWPWERDD
ncbi:hypothetical protein RYJ27_11595 [Microbacterium limosum]|uniref:Major facilitator superfamily (MFS) profile domain-containing protein n=1 Tax=Microbacterium limosum TaxID=3079935 RepID=A0AAU0MGG4_9MICO|nr:hypothetical protein [Microbacterium sp. Y20]WOQ69328.1 hypothetical protein RYJ27_11595 [Microbacterium sp. Y20]